jgi:sugar phosphate isomerase/epimerase
MSVAPHELGKLIGMTLIAGREDIETAVATIKDLGFDGTEVHGSHIGPGMPGVPVLEAHAAAVGDVVRRAGLFVSTLNVVGDETFDPFGAGNAREKTINGLAAHMRWAAAMGAPRVLIWEGRVERRQDVAMACRTLAEIIETAARRSKLATPPPVSVEAHTFTFGLKHRALPELAAALRSVGAGICLDFCHFGVALGRDHIVEALDDDVLAAIDHVHYADTDTRNSELHFPPGEGVIDIDAIGLRITGRPLAVSWDLFGWPGPRHAIRTKMSIYRSFVERHAASAPRKSRAS